MIVLLMLFSITLFTGGYSNPIPTHQEMEESKSQDTLSALPTPVKQEESAEEAWPSNGVPRRRRSSASYLRSLSHTLRQSIRSVLPTTPAGGDHPSMASADDFTSQGDFEMPPPMHRPSHRRGAKGPYLKTSLSAEECFTFNSASPLTASDDDLPTGHSAEEDGMGMMTPKKPFQAPPELAFFVSPPPPPLSDFMSAPSPAVFAPMPPTQGSPVILAPLGPVSPLLRSHSQEVELEEMERPLRLEAEQEQLAIDVAEFSLSEDDDLNLSRCSDLPAAREEEEEEEDDLPSSFRSVNLEDFGDVAPPLADPHTQQEFSHPHGSRPEVFQSLPVSPHIQTRATDRRDTGDRDEENDSHLQNVHFSPSSPTEKWNESKPTNRRTYSDSVPGLSWDGSYLDLELEQKERFRNLIPELCQPKPLRSASQHLNHGTAPPREDELLRHIRQNSRVMASHPLKRRQPKGVSDIAADTAWSEETEV